MATFTCTRCGQPFELPETVLARYPGWTPKACRACRDEGGIGGSSGGGKPEPRGGRPRRSRASAREEGMSVADVLERYKDGPDTGVFTDGAADPNPGPGGWGAVYVLGGDIIDQAHGHEPHTTNNRMELTAIAEGIQLVPAGTPAVVWSDSKLCVDTLTQWARGWARRGWTRKTGPVQNLDLVKPLYEALSQRPELELRWIRAHDGSRWNEYADALATAYRRDAL